MPTCPSPHPTYISILCFGKQPLSSPRNGPTVQGLIVFVGKVKWKVFSNHRRFTFLYLQKLALAELKGAGGGGGGGGAGGGGGNSMVQDRRPLHI